MLALGLIKNFPFLPSSLRENILKCWREITVSLEFYPQLNDHSRLRMKFKNISFTTELIEKSIR
jgi:hypothetical protein